MCENRTHRKPKVSDGRRVHVGLVGPKLRANAVGDGQTVYIPLPLADDKVPLGGRCGVGRGWRWRCRLQARSPLYRGARRGAAAARAKAIRLILGAEKSPIGEAAGARTANRHRWAGVSTPRWTGDPSLRNSANWPRNLGRRGALWGEFSDEPWGAAESRPRRLFNKNTGPCQSES